MLCDILWCIYLDAFCDLELDHLNSRYHTPNLWYGKITDNLISGLFDIHIKNCITCVENIMVLPAFRISSIMDLSKSVFNGSRPENGSSSIIRSGSLIAVTANCSFWCIPLDSSSTFLFARSNNSTRLSKWETRLDRWLPLSPLIAPKKVSTLATVIFL